MECTSALPEKQGSDCPPNVHKTTQQMFLARLFQELWLRRLRRFGSGGLVQVVWFRRCAFSKG